MLAPSVAPPSVAPPIHHRLLQQLSWQLPVAAALSVAPPSTFTLNARAVPPLALLLHYYRSLYHSSSRLLSSPLDPLLLLVGRSTIARSIRSLGLSVRSLQRRSLVRSRCRPLAMPVLARDAARLQCRFSLYRRSLYTAFARLLAHGD